MLSSFLHQHSVFITTLLKRSYVTLCLTLDAASTSNDLDNGDLACVRPEFIQNHMNHCMITIVTREFFEKIDGSPVRAAFRNRDLPLR